MTISIDDLIKDQQNWQLLIPPGLICFGALTSVKHMACNTAIAEEFLALYPGAVALEMKSAINSVRQPAQLAGQMVEFRKLLDSRLDLVAPTAMILLTCVSQLESIGLKPESLTRILNSLYSQFPDSVLDKVSQWTQASSNFGFVDAAQK